MQQNSLGMLAGDYQRAVEVCSLANAVKKEILLKVCRGFLYDVCKVSESGEQLYCQPKSCDASYTVSYICYCLRYPAFPLQLLDFRKYDTGVTVC